MHLPPTALPTAAAAASSSSSKEAGVVLVDQPIFRKANGKMAVPATEVRSVPGHARGWFEFDRPCVCTRAREGG